MALHAYSLHCWAAFGFVYAWYDKSLPYHRVIMPQLEAMVGGVFQFWCLHSAVKLSGLKQWQRGSRDKVWAAIQTCTSCSSPSQYACSAVTHIGIQYTHFTERSIVIVASCRLLCVSDASADSHASKCSLANEPAGPSGIEEKVSGAVQFFIIALGLRERTS